MGNITILLGHVPLYAQISNKSCRQTHVQEGSEIHVAVHTNKLCEHEDVHARLHITYIQRDNRTK